MSNQNFNVYVCTKSTIKLTAVEDFFKRTIELFKKKCNIIPLNIDYGTIDQPINENTFCSCFTRLSKAYTYLKLNHKLNDGDKIISLENGIYNCSANDYYDVCVGMIYDTVNKSIKRYNSFGIKIDTGLFEIYTKQNGNINSQLANGVNNYS